MKKYDEEEFANFFIKIQHNLLKFLLYKTNDELISENLLNNIYDKTNAYLKKKKNYINANQSQEDRWQKLLFKIAMGLCIDYYRNKNENTISIEKVISNTNEKIKLKDTLGKEDKEIKEIIEKSVIEGDDWKLYKILSSEHRSLQNVATLLLSSEIKKLQQKIREEFPFIFERYNKSITKKIKIGLSYGIVKQSEKDQAEQINRESIIFDYSIIPVAKRFNAYDDIGISALKIVLLSPYYEEDPMNIFMIRKLYPLTLKQKGHFLSISKNGIKKIKNVKRKFNRLFRDFYIYRNGIKKYIELFEDEKNKFPDCLVDNRYVENLFGKAPSADYAKKQLRGRTNRLGLQDRINNNNKIIKEILEEKIRKEI